MSISAFRSAAADALRDGCSLNASPYLTSRVNPPYATFDFSVDYDLTMSSGAYEIAGTLTVWAQRDDEVQSQRLLDELRDPSNAASVAAVLDSDTGVLATVDFLRVVSASKVNVRAVGSPGVEFLTVDFEFELAFSGDN